MKRIVFTTVLAGLLGTFLYAQNNSNNTNHITSVKAVSTVCDQGKTLSTVILQYDAAIRNKSLSTSSYSVEEGEIVKVYSNTSAQTASAGKDGPFVVIELKAETDLNATPRKSHIETAEEKAERDRRQGGPGNQREATWMVRRIHTAISRGEMEPVIIVAPQAMPIGWYVNGNMADPKVQTGPIEDVLIRDLIPYVDSHYRTVASAKGRALEGFSMGGCGALRLAFKYPELFGAVSSVAGAVVRWEEEHMTRALECTFGDVSKPESKAYFDSLHPSVFAAKNAASIIDSGMKVRLFVGTNDKLYDDAGIPITTRFHNELETLGIPHSYTIVPGAEHSPQQLFAPGKADYDVKFWDRAFSTQTRCESSFSDCSS